MALVLRMHSCKVFDHVFLVLWKKLKRMWIMDTLDRCEAGRHSLGCKDWEALKD